jgi:CelD/BcsL family acetyltransferase involved in cellulose biosynthesis
MVADGPLAAPAGSAWTAQGMTPRISFTTDPASLGPAWPHMADRGEHRALPFQAADYLGTWMATIGASRGTRPLFARVDDEAGRPVLLAPLGIEKRYGLSVLGFLDGGVVDYNAPVLFERAAALGETDMRQLWDAMRRALPSFDVALFEKMPPDILGWPNPFRFLATSASRASGHALALSGDWDAYARTRLPRAQDSRRKRRRLAETGPVSFEVAASAADAQRFLEAMIGQKTRRYLETRGIDGFDRPGYRAYFRTMTERFLPGGEVQLCALVAGETIVAAHWGLVAGDRFYYLMPGHEAGNWGRYSPGRLIVENMIEWSYRQGLALFDFGEGDEPFKDEFADTVVPLFDAELAVTVVGQAYLGARKLRRGLARGAVGRRVRAFRSRRWRIGREPVQFSASAPEC